MSKESIIDDTRPNAGRIYDYILGGHHNFEVDRQAAERIIQLLPFLPKALRLQRWCLQDLAVELTEKRGFDLIIDFASGLPTEDHIHIVTEGTTVIYSDRDPVTVEYGREILGDAPNVHYFQADAGRPEELLNNPQVQNILDGRRDVALIYWGISMFLPEEQLAHAARVLYDWSGPNSCWAFNAQGAVDTPTDPAVLQVQKIYEQTGSPQYFRTLERYKQLLEPWQADEKGHISLLDWHGFDETLMNEADRKIFSSTSGMYGAYLAKEGMQK
jgi:hypothetical protein